MHLMQLLSNVRPTNTATTSRHGDNGHPPNLDDAKINSLIKAGIRTEHELLITDKEHIRSISGLSNRDLDNITARVAARVSCPIVPGWSALNQAETITKKFSTGCPGIDFLLGGGLSSGEIIEFAGPPVSGKTQMAFFAMITTVASHSNATTLFIDTGNVFSPTRLSEMFTHSDRFEQYRNSGMTWESVSSRIQCVKSFKPYELLEALVSIQAQLSCDEPSVFYRNLHLIVIDSVGALFASIVGGGLDAPARVQNQAIMQTTGQFLKVISTVHGIPIIAINYAVLKRADRDRDYEPQQQSNPNPQAPNTTSLSRHQNLPSPPPPPSHNQNRSSSTNYSSITSSTPTSNTFIGMKPALGVSWQEIPTISLFFSKPAEEEWSSVSDHNVKKETDNEDEDGDTGGDYPSKRVKVGEGSSSGGNGGSARGKRLPVDMDVLTFRNKAGCVINVKRRRVEVLRHSVVPRGSWRHLYMGGPEMISFFDPE
ncbi:hypothetical protein HDU76_012467 [Blyttiomyces sp. JEL0837]|nr:hypothetical protein HDU76_012467 [Blyttiomyces sp. JEL0837]